MKETVAKFKKLLTDSGAEIVNEETWGLKKMAYAIQKKSTGFYCLLEFQAEPTIVKTLETGYRRDEKVIRHMTVKLDKYAAQYAEKRRNKFAKKLLCVISLIWHLDVVLSPAIRSLFCTFTSLISYLGRVMYNYDEKY